MADIVATGGGALVIKGVKITGKGLDAVKDITKLIDAVSDVKDVAKLAKAFDKMKDTNKMLKVTSGIKETQKLIKVIDEMRDINKVIKVVDGINDTKKLIVIFDGLSDYKKVSKILDGIFNYGKYAKVIDGVKDVNKISKAVEGMRDSKKAGLLLLRLEKTEKAVEILEKVKDYNKADKILREMAAVLRQEYVELVTPFANKLYEIAKKFTVELDIKNMLKTTDEIVRKAHEEGRDISKVWDFLRGRLIVNNKDEAYKVYDNVKKNFKIKRFKNNFETAKSSGYRSLHVNIIQGGKIAEIQIVPRTMYEANDKTHDILELIRGLEKYPIKNKGKILELNEKIIKINNEAWKLFP